MSPVIANAQQRQKRNGIGSSLTEARWPYSSLFGMLCLIVRWLRCPLFKPLSSSYLNFNIPGQLQRHSEKFGQDIRCHSGKLGNKSSLSYQLAPLLPYFLTAKSFALIFIDSRISSDLLKGLIKADLPGSPRNWKYTWWDEIDIWSLYVIFIF